MKMMDKAMILCSAGNPIEKLEQFIEHLQEENRKLKKAQHTVTVPHAKSV